MSVYSDMHPRLDITQTGAIPLNYDADVVLQSVKSIFATVVGERVRNPIGTRILRLLFQRMDYDLARQIRDELAGAITTYEPRAQVMSFTLTPNFDANSYEAVLVLGIAGVQNNFTLRTRLRTFTP